MSYPAGIALLNLAPENVDHCEVNGWGAPNPVVWVFMKDGDLYPICPNLEETP